jgi:hypothetical protein
MTEPTFIVTSRYIKDRYRALLEAQAREHNAAAVEWQQLHRWEWRKRRRLHRVLYGVGGWCVGGLADAGIPERVARCGWRLKEGGC